jgi:hypothetical protein
MLAINEPHSKREIINIVFERIGFIGAEFGKKIIKMFLQVM